MSANTTPINYMISGTSEHDNVVFKDVSEFESDSDSNTSGDEENEENGEWGDTEEEIDRLYAHMVNEIDQTATTLDGEDNIGDNYSWTGGQEGHNGLNSTVEGGDEEVSERGGDAIENEDDG